MNKLKDFIQKNIIQNIFVKYQRKYKTTGFKLNVFQGFKFNKRVIIIAIIVVIILFFCFNYLNKSLSLNFSRDLEDQSTTLTEIYDTSRYSVVLFGFNDLNPESEYKFLDYIVQVKIDSRKSDIRVFAINPYILVPRGSNQYTLSSFINNVDDSSLKFTELQNKITGLSTQTVNRYISFNYSDLAEISNLLGIDHRVLSSVKSGDNYYGEGTFVDGEDLGDFFSISTGDEIAKNLQEKISFFETFHLSLKNPFKQFGLIDNAAKLSNVLKTNMTASEFRKFVNDIAYGEIIREGFTNKEDYFSIPEKYEDGFKVSDVILDDKLLSIFSRIELVSEQAKIEVYNASDTSGLAYQYKRRLENQGSIVVKTGNYPEKPKENTLYIPNANKDNFKETIDLISGILGGDVTIVTGAYKYNYSGDLILILVK